LPLCDGAYCGSNGCDGSCGVCEVGKGCNDIGRCVADPCIPDCTGKTCGDDGCTGECGSCTGNDLCVDATFTCELFNPCDSLLPECIGGCASNEYCGTDCTCYELGEPRPDLYINIASLTSDIIYTNTQFSETSCALYEHCIVSSGNRYLMRMTLETVNQGFANLEPPDPKSTPSLFTYSACHNHYHFNGFASIDLVNKHNDDIVIKGSKVGFCMEDSVQFLRSPAFSCDPQYDCGHQGIQAGWSDIYGSSLDCNWLDVTGLATGEYRLRVEVNPLRLFDEVSFDNNVSIIPISFVNPTDVDSNSETSSPTSDSSSPNSNSNHHHNSPSSSSSVLGMSAACLLGGVAVLF